MVLGGNSFIVVFYIRLSSNNKGNCGWNLGNLKKVEHRSSGLRQPLSDASSAVFWILYLFKKYIYTHSYIVYLFTFFV